MAGVAGVRFVAALRVRGTRGFDGVAAFTAAVMRAANAGECNREETSVSIDMCGSVVVAAAYPIVAAVGVKLGA